MNKQLSIFFMLTLLMSMVGTSATAHDFEVENSDGVTIYYNYINNETELAVTFRGEYRPWKNCPYSGTVVIPEEVTYNGKTLKVTSIGEGAFYQGENITSVTIPNSVKCIGVTAFADCENMTSVNIPDHVTAIGEAAFQNCRGLTSINIPNGLKIIEDQTFENCRGLTSINIPNSVTSIGRMAFTSCNGLTSINIPNSVTTIRDCAFFWCQNLTSVTIPNSVTTIGERVFERCTNLNSIVVDANNSVYDSRNNCNAIIETNSNTLLQGCQNTIIPNSVTSIGDWAFYYRDINSLIIPNGVKSIGMCAFGYINITSVVLPNSLISIGKEAFSGCGDLTDVYCYAESVPEMGWEVFTWYLFENATLHVPASSLNAYRHADQWKACKNIVALTDNDPKPVGITNINNEAKTIEHYYSLDGKRMTTLQRGLNIIRTADGKNKKVIRP